MLLAVLTVLLFMLGVLAQVLSVVIGAYTADWTHLRWGFGALAGALVAGTLLGKHAAERNIRDMLNRCRKILESEGSFTPVNPADYPAELTDCYDQLQSELEKLHFVKEIDCVYFAVEACREMFGRIFVRFMRNPDGTVWATLIKLRPDWYLRPFVPLLIGPGYMTGFFSLGSTFSDGSVLECSNARCKTHGPTRPGQIKIDLPEGTVWNTVGAFAEASAKHSIENRCQAIAYPDFTAFFVELRRQELDEALHALQHIPSLNELIDHYHCSHEVAEGLIAAYRRAHGIKGDPPPDNTTK